MLTILLQKRDSALLTQIRRRIASLMIEKRESDRGSVVFSSSRSVCPSLFSRSRSHDSSPLSLDLVSSSSRSIASSSSLSVSPLSETLFSLVFVYFILFYILYFIQILNVFIIILIYFLFIYFTFINLNYCIVFYLFILS